MQKTEKPLVLAAVLFIITALVALLLACTNSLTAQTIAENSAKEQDEARKEVLAEADSFEKLEGYPKEDSLVQEAYIGKAGGETAGWCFMVSPVGYGGEMEMAVGISKDLVVSGIKLISHSETAGLGAKAQDASFTEQFAGKPASGELSVIKSGEPAENEIVAISGATITSNAVRDGVNAAIEAAQELAGEGGAQQ